MAAVLRCFILLWMTGWMDGWMDVHGQCQTGGAFLAIVRLWFGAFLEVLQLSPCCHVPFSLRLHCFFQTSFSNH